MMLSKPLWDLRQWARQVWPRVSLFSIVALIVALLAPVISPLLPKSLQFEIGEDAVLSLISILTNSMLAVSTFSLSVMVTAHHFASGQVTPRSHRLLREDSRTQSVIATFIGAFVYGLTATVIVRAGLFGDRDYPVLYATTVIVIILVVVALIRWVQQLAGLGSVEKTTGRVERATRQAMEAQAATPFLGARPLAVNETDDGIAIEAKTHGYVRHVDTAGLNELARDHDGEVHVLTLPGTWVSPGQPILRWLGAPGPHMDALAEQVTIGELRSYQQDPEFGLTVMSEIGQRALSPGINDPGTAIDVLHRQERLLALWRRPEASQEALPFVRAPAFDPADLIRAAFNPIARDGAGVVEVCVTLQRALSRLALSDDSALARAARAASARALALSDAALPLDSDRATVRAQAPGGSTGG